MHETAVLASQNSIFSYNLLELISQSWLCPFDKTPTVLEHTLLMATWNPGFESNGYVLSYHNLLIKRFIWHFSVSWCRSYAQFADDYSLSHMDGSNPRSYIFTDSSFIPTHSQFHHAKQIQLKDGLYGTLTESMKRTMTPKLKFSKYLFLKPSVRLLYTHLNWQRQACLISLSSRH